MTTDRIEKRILLRAPRTQVWDALADSDAFGRWFGVKLDGPFAPGARIRGKVTHPGWEHIPFEITIDKVVPQKLFSWRWHPHPIDPEADYSAEPTTLVVFSLEDAPEGTLLTVVESGFDAIPSHRRAEAWRGNEQGWAAQMEAIERYVCED